MKVWPERTIVIHKEYLPYQTDRIKEAIHLLTAKDRLNDGDIQAIRKLLDVCDALLNPASGIREQDPTEKNSTDQ